MLYGQIENGKMISGPKPLPKCTKNISGFNLLSDDELKKHGWLPVEGNEYDPETQNRSEPDIQEDKIIYTVTDKPEQELLNKYIDSFKQEFTNTAYEELLVTDWKIIRQIEQNTLSEDDYSSLITQRQKIRDKHSEKEKSLNSIAASGTLEDLENVKWND